VIRAIDGTAFEAQCPAPFSDSEFFVSTGSEDFFNQEHRRLIGVVVSNALSMHAKRPFLLGWIVSPGRQSGAAALSVGGSAGVPRCVAVLLKKRSRSTGFIDLWL
jgi:orotate phosphoribosyltransferase-like protein